MSDISDLYLLIHDRREWEPGFETLLQPFGFEDHGKAWENLVTLSGQANFAELYPNFFSSFLGLISSSYNSDLALYNFERFSQKLFDKNYFYTLLSGEPEFLKALIFLFSGSQILTDTLLNDPSHFDWLKQPDTLNKRKKKDVLFRDFHMLSGSDHFGEDTPSLLRRFKKREYIRIGLRDLMGLADVMETVECLSDLADVCLQVAYEYADAKLTKKHGIPFYEDSDGKFKQADFAVISMGKLGGKELNFSSDIDIIYIYRSSKGETRPTDSSSGSVTVSNHEYFTRLAQLITRTINEITDEGNVFRVDLNLRPEGQSGEITNSLASCEIYYESWGRTWERQAMIRARVSAGSNALGKFFFDFMEPFIYRRSLDFSALEEIKSLKKKTDENLRQKNLQRGNIKLGFGGIRETEFIVQSFQLLFGGRDKNLREPNTLIALKALLDKNLMTREEVDRLQEAYLFLRKLENMVQISFGLQTHVMPKDSKSQAVLARKMGFIGGANEDLVKQLNNEFDHHTRFVGHFFANLFKDEQDQEAANQLSNEQNAEPGEGLLTLEYLESEKFKDPKKTLKFLEVLRDGPQFSHPSEKSIQTFYAILPRILDLSRQAPNPDSAIENLVRFVEASRARETFFDLFQSNEKFLELLLILFGGIDVLSKILIKQPGLMDVLLNLESLYRFKPPEKIVEDLRRNLETCPDLNSKSLFLRKFKQGEELRIGMRYLIKETDLPGTLADLSSLADVYLQTVYNLACEEGRKQMDDPSSFPDHMAIIALGKLGGQEINFGSDLDVVFVYDDSAREGLKVSAGAPVSHYTSIYKMVYRLTAEITSAGFAYKIDTDLRPEGNQGELVVSLSGYKDYFSTRARIWEQQAMTRARFVAGDPNVGKKFIEIAHSFTYTKKLEYGSLIEISRLRERMEKELAQETDSRKNVKIGFGGLADIEFTLQILQLMHGRKYPKCRQTHTLKIVEVMSSYGIISHGDSEMLKESYLFLRNLECALRLLSEKVDNRLPEDEDSRALLARLLGYEGKDSSQLAGELMENYQSTTHQVRKFYRATIDTLLRTSL